MNMARLPKKVEGKPGAIPSRAKPSKLAESDSKLKQLKDQAEDLGTARNSLDDAVSMTRGLWISFISLSAYLMVAVGSVTHVDLFLENPLQLPLVGVKVPLVVFFWLAPIIYLIVHTYLLLNLKLMSDNVRSWLLRLETTLSKEARPEERERVAEEHRLALPNFFPVQMLSATKFNRSGFIGGVLLASVLITVAVGPILLLFMFQTQFLPYHAEAVTWVHRLSLIADIVLVWYFWPRIYNRSGGRMGVTAMFLAANATGALVLLSLVAATFPGELIYFKSNSIRDALFEGGVDKLTGVPRSLFANRLVLTNKVFVNLDEAALAKVETTLSLRGRHLENAVLVHANLRKADFSGALMGEAIFSESILDEASFRCGTLSVGTLSRANSRIKCAELQDAKFDTASLVGAKFDKASLSGTTFIAAQLKNASFKDARLDGANFADALLEGADFDHARLNGAAFDKSNIQNANFRDAKLIGVSVRNSNLSGAQFTSAILDGALFLNSNLGGAEFESASLRGAMVLRSDLRGAHFFDNKWELAVLQSELVDDLGAFGQVRPAPANSEQVAPMESNGASGTRVPNSRVRNLPTSNAEWETIARNSLKLPTNAQSDVWRSKGWEDRIEFIRRLACENSDAPYVINALTFLREFGRPTPDNSQVFSTGPYLPALASFLLAPEKCPNRENLNLLSKRQLEKWACTPLSFEVTLRGAATERAKDSKENCLKTG